MTDRPVLRAMRMGLREMLRYPRLAALFLAATLAQGVLQGLLIWALRDILLSFQHSGRVTLGALAAGGAGILVLWSLRAAGTFAAEELSVRLAYRVESGEMQRVLEKLLTLDLRFFERNSQGDLMQATYHDLIGIRTVTLHVGNIILYASRLVSLAVVAAVISPKLAIIGFALVPVGLLPASRFGTRVTQAARDEHRKLSGLLTTLMQVTAGIRIIKVNAGERAFLDRVAETSEARFKLQVRASHGRGMARLFFEAVTGLGLVLVLTIGARDVVNGVLQWQSLLSLLVAIMAVSSPMLGMLQVYSGISSVLPNLEGVERVMHAPSGVRDAPDARPLAAAPREIALEQVSFSYDGSDVLHSLTATFRAGETIGLVGPSGAGKTTLLALLLRLYDASAGRVLYDGVDVRQLRHADLMRHCAIVVQEPFLFLDTAASNIRIGRPNASMDEVVEAARAAHIHDVIMGMEHGYDTVLGHGGGARGLSVGQKQRICIAAALLKNAPLLFLDEATSNLDAASEEHVHAAIRRLMSGRTTFVVAHRFSTLRHADRVLVLREGRVEGLGTHEELLASCPTYAELWTMQDLGGQGAIPVTWGVSDHLEGRGRRAARA